MIKAIYHDGQICPLDPVPADWVDGQSLQVQTALLDSRLVQEFARLVQAWKRDTRYISSPTEIATHPAYQRIIGLGREVVPLILADLRQEPAGQGGERDVALLEHAREHVVAPQDGAPYRGSRSDMGECEGSSRRWIEFSWQEPPQAQMGVLKKTQWGNYKQILRINSFFPLFEVSQIKYIF